MSATFGILCPDPPMLEAWQRRTVEGLVGTGVARAIAWNDCPRRAWPSAPGTTGLLVSCADLVIRKEDRRPDFWLNFGPAHPGEDVWSFEGCPLDDYAGPGRVLTLALSTGRLLLHRARIRLHSSFATTCARWLEVATQLPARACVQMRTMGQDSFASVRREPVRSPSPRALFWHRLRRFLRDKLEDFFVHDIWNVGVMEGTWPFELDPARVRWFPARPALRFIADPFPLNRNEYLVEEYGYGRRSRGRICRVGPEGLTPEIVEPFHLSYPHLVRSGADLYCIPESHGDRSCRLYRWNGVSWNFEGRILEGLELVDATFFEHENRWWAFCSDREDGGFCRLLAFHAPELRGPWTPHQLNPLKRDLRGARPAGPLFRDRESFLRPGQNCTRTYGGGLVLFRIEELTPSTFQEEEIMEIPPLRDSPYPDGIHHLVVEQERVVFDAKRTVFNCLFWLRRLLREN